MQQEIRAEDLIVTEADGSRHINHEMLKEYGLFNLPKSIMRSALMVYYENARRHSQPAANRVHTFICISNSIARFPREVAVNFTRGTTYHHNMEFLERYSK